VLFCFQQRHHYIPEKGLTLKKFESIIENPNKYSNNKGEEPWLR
jgi:hypothetical protein